MDIQPTQSMAPDNPASVVSDQPAVPNLSTSQTVAATPNDKPTSDDEELAKVLAGLTTEAKKPDINELSAKVPDVSSVSLPVDSIPPLAPKPDFTIPAPQMPAEANLTEAASDAPMEDQSKTASLSPELEDVRKNALQELRPLVGTLDLSPEEKFDIYLLLLRSTDDTSLIAPAYDVAKQIGDESKRAQALLDVVKEIDYLSNPE